MSKIAVIKTGGKQYLVAEKQILKVERVNGKVDEEVIFPEVLLLADESNQEVKVGKPKIEGVKVSAKILQQRLNDKIRVIKYKSKVRYHRKRGHRQYFTQVQITRIQ